MNFDTKLDTRNVIIGLVGFLTCVAIFIGAQAYPDSIRAYQFIYPVSLLGALFFCGFGLTGSIVTSAVTPVVIFLIFAAAPLYPKSIVRLIGTLSIPLAIYLAVLVHKRLH